MNGLKKIVSLAAIVVFFICLYSFMLANGAFSGRFDNDPIGWYILAKGIFCSLALYLLVRVLELLVDTKR
ncbi:MAG: hypothetical protein P8Y09_00765 [Deltaproteobacteria bacterium]|jgi:hypothetical protein